MERTGLSKAPIFKKVGAIMSYKETIEYKGRTIAAVIDDSITAEEYLNCQQYLEKSFARLYWCGHSLKDVFNTRLFYRFNYANEPNRGMCYEASALVMMALRDDTTTRICQGKTDSGLSHAWVEFCFHGKELVIDPAWGANGYLVGHQAHRFGSSVKAKYVCSYRQFWSFATSSQFYDCLRDSQTSHLVNELALYSPDVNEDYGLSKELTSGRVPLFGQDLGARTIPFLLCEGRYVTQETIDYMMQHPNAESLPPEMKARAEQLKHFCLATSRAV